MINRNNRAVDDEILPGPGRFPEAASDDFLAEAKRNFQGDERLFPCGTISPSRMLQCIVEKEIPIRQNSMNHNFSYGI